MAIKLNEVGGFKVQVAKTLLAAQRAIKAGDAKMQASGESVLSALALVLKHQEAILPGEMLPHYKRITGEE